MRISFCPFCGNASSSGERCSKCGQVTPALPGMAPAAAPPPPPPPVPKKPAPKMDFGRTINTSTADFAQSIAELSPAHLQTIAEPPPAAAPPPVPVVGRPRALERVENLGVGPVLVVASLLAQKGQQDAAIRLLERATERFKDVQDSARIRLSLASLKAALGRLTENDLSAVAASALRADSERATLAQLYRMMGARAQKPADAKRAALRALSIGGHALLGDTPIDPQVRLGVVFAAGVVDEAADLALAKWRSNPADAEALQVAASAFLRRAIALEEKPEIGLDARRNAWERAIGAWAMICAPSTSFWQRFAAVRGVVYQKDISAEMITEAQNGTKDRVAKALRDLEARHRDAGRTAERAQIGRFVQTFSAEIEAAEKMWGLIRSLPQLRLPPMQLPFPCGPLGLDVLAYREDISIWLARLDGQSQDPRVKELLDGMGTLAEGWAMLRDNKLAEAAEYARARHKAAPGDREAIRLLQQTVMKKVERCLADSDVDGALGALAWFEPKDLPEELAPMLEAVSGILAEREQIPRARELIRTIANAQPGQPKWKDCEANVLVGLALKRAQAEDFLAALNVMQEALKIAPHNVQIQDFVGLMSRNLAGSTIKKSSPEQAVTLMESLGAEQNPLLRLALAMAVNSRGCAHANAGRTGPGVTDLERAHALVQGLPESEMKSSIGATILENLRGTLMEEALLTLKASMHSDYYSKQGARAKAVANLRRAHKLGAPEAAGFLRQMGEIVW